MDLKNIRELKHQNRLLKQAVINSKADIHYKGNHAVKFSAFYSSIEIVKLLKEICNNRFRVISVTHH